MRGIAMTVCALTLAAVSTTRGGQESTRVESRIISAALFKNGLAVIRREITITGPGVYEVLDVPEPVHGTFWIESDAVVLTRVTSREIAVTESASVGWNVQSELAGSSVTIHLKESDRPPITGIVVDVGTGADSARAWDRTYETDPYGRWWNGHAWSSTATVGGAPRFIVLKTDAGRTYIDSNSVASIDIIGEPRTPMRRQSVLEFTVSASESGAMRDSRILVTYLAKGLTWAPAYRVDLHDSSTLNLEQHAVIRNELEDVRDVELQLISGYPSIEFSHVDSLLSPRTSLAAFFRQLSRDSSDWFTRGPVTQQLAGNFAASDEGPPIGAPPVGEGVDLHYQSIGRHTLNEGDSMLLTVAEAGTEYARIVEWLIPDTRDEFGNRVPERRWRDDPQRYDDAPWDALRFRNPLPFAMTTAPAMIIDGGRFAGQRMSTWTNAGEPASVRITKALSVRTRNVEREEPDARELLNIGGRAYRRVSVLGEASATNHRGEPITLDIRRRFSGELETADRSPRTTLLEEGAYSINARNELQWTIELAPGETVTLNYRYTVLVPH